MSRTSATTTVELPNFVELAVARTDPGVRGDTAQGGTKPATLETGAVVQVPLFLNEGDVVKIDTRTGEYLGRVFNETKRRPLYLVESFLEMLFVVCDDHAAAGFFGHLFCDAGIAAEA